METKFTKGEWHARIGFNNQWTIFNENALGVANVVKWTVKSEEEAEANAKLIAAAPDMFEHLQSIIDGNAFDPETGHIWEHRLQAIKDTLSQL